MKLPDIPIANPVAVLREEFDDWAVLFNPDTADAVGINPVGVTIWKAMDGKHSIKDIIAQIKDEFDDVPTAASDEIQAFVAKLQEKGFVGFEVDEG